MMAWKNEQSAALNRRELTTSLEAMRRWIATMNTGDMIDEQSGLSVDDVLTVIGAADAVVELLDIKPGRVPPPA
jgi:hypothetical protein